MNELSDGLVAHLTGRVVRFEYRRAPQGSWRAGIVLKILDHPHQPLVQDGAVVAEITASGYPFGYDDSLGIEIARLLTERAKDVQLAMKPGIKRVRRVIETEAKPLPPPDSRLNHFR